MPCLWTFDQLVRFARYEDPEVRYWAVDRLIHLYPEQAADPLAKLLFDDHEATPMLVAEHLASRGGDPDQAPLERGFRRGSSAFAAQCLAALCRLGSASVPELAHEAIHRRDLDEADLSTIVSGLGAMFEERGLEAAADAAREILLHRPEIYAEPGALEAGLKIFGDRRLGDLAGKWITSVHFRGVETADQGIRVFHEGLQIEDISWCLRTDRTGRVDLERSLRAIENGYDREIRTFISATNRASLATAFSRGEFREMASLLAELAESRARSAAETAAADDPLPGRLAALASGFRREEVLVEADRLGHGMHAWLIGLLLSILVKTVDYRNLALECQRAEGDLDALLALAELESSFLTRELPARLKEAAGDEGRERLERWCVGTLEARGPFFPKVIAMELSAELQLTSQIPLIIRYLSDDNGWIYGTAERILARLGDDAVAAIRSQMERQRLHPDSMSSILSILAEIMTADALAVVLEWFDDFMQAAGPEEGAELMALLGSRTMIPPMRRWLARASGDGSQVAVRARVGHALLILGAIHNVAIPEEESILRAIDEYWQEMPEGSSGQSGPYLM